MAQSKLKDVFLICKNCGREAYFNNPERWKAQFWTDYPTAKYSKQSRKTKLPEKFGGQVRDVFCGSFTCSGCQHRLA